MKRPLNVSGEVKRAAVKRVAAGEPVSKVASDLKIDRRRLYEWQAQAAEVVLKRCGGQVGRAAARWMADRCAVRCSMRGRRRGGEEVAELERKVGEQQADLDFFRQALRHVKARQQADAKPGALRSTKSSGR